MCMWPCRRHGPPLLSSVCDVEHNAKGNEQRLCGHTLIVAVAHVMCVLCCAVSTSHSLPTKLGHH